MFEIIKYKQLLKITKDNFDTVNIMMFLTIYESLKSRLHLRTHSQIVTYLSTVVVVTILLILRLLPSIKASFIAWEDGRIFLSESLSLSFIDSVLKTYAGYYHLLPRIFAQLASLYNLLLVPRISIISSLLFAACILSLPVLDIFNNLMKKNLRIIYAIACTVVPVSSEVMGNITCLHWYAFYGLLLFSIADLRSIRPAGLVMITFYSLITVFSSPPTVILVPLLVLQAIMYRKYKMVVIFDFLVVVFCLLFFMLCSKQGSSVVLPAIHDLFIFVTRTGGFKSIIMPMLGQKMTMDYLQLPVVSIMAFMLLYVTISFAVLKTFKDRMINKSILLLSLMYAFSAPLILTGITRANYIKYFVHDGGFSGADRYFVTSIYILLLLVIMVINAGLTYMTKYTRMAVIIIIIALYSLPISRNFKCDIPVQAEYNWRNSILEYYSAIVTNKNVTVLDESWTIPIFPGDTWCVFLPAPDSLTKAECARIATVFLENLESNK